MAASKAKSKAGPAALLLALLVGSAAPSGRSAPPPEPDAAVVALGRGSEPRPKLAALARRSLLFGLTRASRGRTGPSSLGYPDWLEASEERARARQFGTLPLRPPIEPLVVSSGFGRRTSPFSGRLVPHWGLDLTAPRGTLVRAAGEGIVRRTGWDGAFGRVVEIDHGDGLVSVYAHLERILVRSGMRVTAGQPIGRVGISGRSTGPHLHFEVRLAGRPQDPARWLEAGLLLAAIGGAESLIAALPAIAAQSGGMGGEVEPGP